MTKEEYQYSEQYQHYLAQIIKACEEKVKIQDDDALISKERAEKVARISKKLMKEMRRLKLYIRNDYIKEFRSGTVATIDPENPCVKVSIEKSEQNDYTVIYANSCGPFRPIKYFMPDIRTKVQFLKESYITKKRYDDEKHPDRGGHNLADYYSTWENIKANDEANGTKGLLVDLIKTLDEKIDGISTDDAKTDDEAMNKAMDSICFFELNLFPGLSLNNTASDDELIKKWAEFNKEIFEYLIKFYSPKILVGAGKQMKQSPTVNDKVQELIESFSQPIGQINYGSEKNYYEPYKLVRYDYGFIFVDAYHPAYRAYEQMKLAGKAIRPLLTDK